MDPETKCKGAHNHRDVDDWREGVQKFPAKAKGVAGAGADAGAVEAYCISC